MEKGITLYEITEAYKKIESLLDVVEDGTGGLNVYLDSIQDQMENKVNNIVRYSKNLELTSLAISAEVDRLVDLKKAYDRKSKALIDYISYSMQKNSIERVDTDVCKLSFIKSTSVEIDDISKLPKKYIVEKISYSPDKKAIKEAIKKGKQVSGARLEDKKNLQIK